MSLSEFQDRIGYHFKNQKLLFQALTHSSYAHETFHRRDKCNERLEFLGDAVLEMVSSEFIYLHYPEKPEGEMSKLRASLVCEPTLAACAEPIGLKEEILLGKGEELTGGRERNSIISDALESVIGAIFLDSGIVPARDFILRVILTDIDTKKLFYDSKTTLQEIIQARHKAVSYSSTVSEGPGNSKIFHAEVSVGEDMLGEGVGPNRKAAEQEAAYHALVAIRGGKFPQYPFPGI